MKRCPWALQAAAVAGTVAALCAAPATAQMLPSIAANLQVHYDFEHADANNAGLELDQGLSGTTGWL